MNHPVSFSFSAGFFDVYFSIGETFDFLYDEIDPREIARYEEHGKARVRREAKKDQLVDSRARKEDDEADARNAYIPPLGPVDPLNPRCFFDISIGETHTGRVELEVKLDVAPITGENFLQLCENAPGEGYAGSDFHRVIPGFMAQGGKYDQRGGKSANGGSFDDENFELLHTGPGVLAMANRGPDTNGAQFYITFAKTPWLDGKHVVFGQVAAGWHVVQAMELAGAEDGHPTRVVRITNAGVIEV